MSNHSSVAEWLTWSPTAVAVGMKANSTYPNIPDEAAGKGDLDRPGRVFSSSHMHTMFFCCYLCGFWESWVLELMLHARHERLYVYKSCFFKSVKIQLIPQHHLCLNCLFELFLYSSERYKNFCKMMCPEACLFFPDISVGLIIIKKIYFSVQTVLSLCYLDIFIGLQKLVPYAVTYGICILFCVQVYVAFTV